MAVILCKAKLSRATVTSCQRDAPGSIAIDERVLAALRIYPYEKVLVVNRTNGERFETYIIPGERGVIELQGGTALLGKVGDVIGLLAFAVVEEPVSENWRPLVVRMEPDNQIHAEGHVAKRI